MRSRKLTVINVTTRLIEYAQNLSAEPLPFKHKGCNRLQKNVARLGRGAEEERMVLEGYRKPKFIDKESFQIKPS